MKRVAVILAVVAVLASVATGALVWQLTRHPASQHPEISAYTHGQLVRVGPYRYCQPKDLHDCEFPETTGELTLNAHDQVQLSVPPAIARAPWVLVLNYEDPATPPLQFARNSKLAVTIPSVDPRYGKLLGFAVQLPTWVQDEQGNEFPLPHAEWAVRTVWP